MKRFTAALLACLFMMNIAVCAEEIYKYETVETLTNGVEWKNIKRFYNDYSLNINCITADLKNEHLSMELLKSNKGIDKVDTLLSLANAQENVVAAVNADFFSYYKGSQNFSLGIEIKDGELLQSHIDPNMAAGIITDDVLSLGYIELKSELTAANGNILPVTHINKPTDYYGALLMYTPDFNGAVSPFFPEGISVVTVTDGIVTGMGVSMGGTVPIPKNGYILAINDNMTPMLNINMALGDKVELKTTAKPSIKNADTAFGGGTMLLANGEKTKITHKSAGNNPRTAVGTNADGTVVYLITVDGRQSSSRGVSLEALADICLELGCSYAMNLDGGGSTSMVGKELENSSLHHLNSPSENRKVINGIGIVSDAVGSKVAGFKVTAESYNVLAGDSVKIEVLPYDEYHNPIEAPEYKWVVSKGSGSVENNVFKSDKGGEAVADLYYKNNWQASCTFNVIEDVYGINAPVKLSIAPGKSTEHTGKISVFDENGNTAVVNDITLLKPVCDVTYLAIDNKKITALKKGSGNIVLRYGNAERSIAVSSDETATKAPDPVFSDNLNKKQTGAYTFNVIAGLPDNTFLGRLMYKNAMEKFSKGNASALLGGSIIKDFTPDNTQPVIADGYKEAAIKNSRVVSIDLTSTKSLRTGNQWDKLKQIGTYAKEQNLFILINKAPEFSDAFEKQVFCDYLKDVAKVKNVFVVYNGDENSCTIKDNVRYISLADRADYSTATGAVNEIKYVSFSIGENAVTYVLEALY